MVWYSHLFQNFPQFVVICTVKALAHNNEEKIDNLKITCFLEFIRALKLQGNKRTKRDLLLQERWEYSLTFGRSQRKMRPPYNGVTRNQPKFFNEFKA